MKNYIASEWQATLKSQNLHSFHDIWNYEKNANLEQDWVEEPNQRRGGWSGVCRIVLQDPRGQPKTVFLKRQSKHTYSSLLSPIKGRLTFRREFRNITRFRKHGIPTVTPIYYGQWEDEAILMTEELTGYRSLDDWILEWQQKGFPSRELYQRIIQEIGRVVRKMHQYCYRHSCLEFKHIFLSLENNEVKVSLIDLEKLRYWPFRNRCRNVDLTRLYRKCAKKVKRTDKWRFIKAYWGEDASKEKVKSLWRSVDALVAKKNNKR
ncbi:MAG: hypothetical protein K2Q33_03800 [Gammaproteobacteria bacterium]|nr:hypothetical protein [Gammaproteobacteria bacterium]